MNRVYKVIWNRSLNRWDITSEVGKFNKKTKSYQSLSKITSIAISSLLMAGSVAVSNLAVAEQPALTENMDLTVNGDYSYTTNGKDSVLLPRKVQLQTILFNDNGKLAFNSNNTKESPQNITIKEIKGDTGNPTKIVLTFNGNFNNTAERKDLTGELTITDSMQTGIDSKVEMRGFNSVKIRELEIESQYGTPVNEEKQDNISKGTVTFSQINTLQADNITVYVKGDKVGPNYQGQLMIENVGIQDEDDNKKSKIENLNLVAKRNENQEPMQGYIGGKAEITDSILTINTINVADIGQLRVTKSTLSIGEMTVTGKTNNTSSRVDMDNSNVTIIGTLSVLEGGRFHFNSPKAQDDTSTLKAENIIVGQNATFTIAGAPVKAKGKVELKTNTIKVDGEKATFELGQKSSLQKQQGSTIVVVKDKIELLNGGTLNVNKTSYSIDEDNNIIKVQLSTPCLVVGNQENQEGKISSLVFEKAFTETLTSKDDKPAILDLTSIDTLEIHNGKVDGLYEDAKFQTKLNNVTFINVAGSSLEVKDLNLMGSGEFHIAVDAKSGSGKAAGQGTLIIDKLTIGEGQGENTARLIASNIKEDSAITSTYPIRDKSGEYGITVKGNGHLTLEGNGDFNFIKSGEGVKLNGEGFKTGDQSVLKVDSKVTVNSGGTVSGSGYISDTLKLDKGADLYVGNSFTLSSDQSNNDSVNFGHLAVDRFETDGGNLHFSLSYEDERAGILTILEGSDGGGTVFIPPVMSRTLRGNGNGEILLVDASAVNYQGSDNNLNLTLEEPVSRGLYEYTLVRKTADKKGDGEVWLGDGEQWYLVPATVEPEKPKRKYEVDPNAYLANLVVSNQMFTLSYEDREYLTDGSGLWTHVSGSFGKLKGNITKDQIATKVNYVTFRIGKDLVSNDQYTLGLMAAYGHASGHSDSNLTHRRADNRVDGFAVGAYGTYYFGETGYVDSWVQYVHTRNKVERSGRPTEKYNANGFLASVEVGNAFTLSDTVTAIPQGQVIYMGVKAKDHWSIDGVKYGSNRGNVQLRLGATLYSTGMMNGGIPYVGINYYHNTSNNKVKIHDTLGGNQDLALTGAKNLFQLKVGSDFKVNNHSRIGGEISHTFGKNSYRDTKVDVNYRYDF